MGNITMEQAERLQRTWNKDRLRFAVIGPTGKTSAAWAIWFHKDSLYLAGRALGRMVKVSLHPGGGFRFAYEASYFASLRERGEAPSSRDIHVWQPPDVKDGETVPVASILFPAENLHGLEKFGERKKPLLLFEVTKPDAAAQIDILLTREPIETLHPKLQASGFPVHAWERSDGAAFVVRVRETVYDRSLLPVRQKDYPVNFPDAFIDANAGKTLTMLLRDAPVDGGLLRLAEIGGVTVRRREVGVVPNSVRPQAA